MSYQNSIKGDPTRGALTTFKVGPTEACLESRKCSYVILLILIPFGIYFYHKIIICKTSKYPKTISFNFENKITGAPLGTSSQGARNSGNMGRFVLNGFTVIDVKEGECFQFTLMNLRQQLQIQSAAFDSQERPFITALWCVYIGSKVQEHAYIGGDAQRMHT